jgi:hypothetical protein
MRIVRVSFLAFLLAALAQSAPAAEGAAAPVRVALHPEDLPISAFKDLDAASSILSEADDPPPEGFHPGASGKLGCSFTEKGTRGGTPVRFLLRGETLHDLRLFFWPQDGAPVEVPRMPEAHIPQNLAFGPWRIEGHPSMSLHLMVPPKLDFEQWNSSRKYIRALAMECLAGETALDGRIFRIAVLDRDCNGRIPDVCVKHAREGDSLLVDENADGAFDVSRNSTECRGLTRCIRFGAKTYRVAVEGRELLLEPCVLPAMKLRFPNLAPGCVVSGWSEASGLFSGALDASNAVEVPADKAVIYNYRWARDGWVLTGSLFNVGNVEPPAGGRVREMEFGPALRGDLTVKGKDGAWAFTFKSLGRGKESAQAAKEGLRNQPTLAIADASGKEVFRQLMSFG